jgi:hypothetical protein
MGASKTVRLVMLWAYFDETAVNAVDDKDGKLRPTEMFVGGCVATVHQWQKFDPKWKRALDRAGVAAFHATDFYAFQGEFKWFDKDGNRDMKRHARFRDRLADIILEHTDELIVFTSLTSIKGHGTRKAYQDAILRAFYDATKFRMRGKNSLYIVLARHPEFSPWSILRRFEQIVGKEIGWLWHFSARRCSASPGRGLCAAFAKQGLGRY